MKTVKAMFTAWLVFSLLTPAFGATAEKTIKVNSELRRTPGRKVVADHIIVKFKRGLRKAKKKTVKKKLGAAFSRRPRSADFEIVGRPAGKTVADMVADYENRPEVEYAEPDYVMSATMVPNDPFYPYQWHLSNPTYGGIDIESAWDLSRGSGVTVAVIDTGIAYEDYSPSPSERYYRAPDLADTSFAPGYDFVNNDTHPNDDNAHGTHVAGTIAQSTDNNLGVAGVAGKAILMPIKVLDKNGNGNDSAVAAGIRYAADHGAKIINMSLGGSPSTALSDAVVYAYGKGVTIVAAAGNDNGPVIYPAAYDQVIAVAATRYDETRSWYSNYGSQVDIAAPGGDTGIDQNGDGYSDGVLQNTFNPNTQERDDFNYWFFQGTSMASPHVAGVAALIASQDPSMTPADIKSRLESTAEDKGSPGWDQYYGWGLLDAGAAVLPASSELLVTALDLQTAAAGTNTWPGDDGKNKPAVIDSTVPWRLLVQAQADFSGGGRTLAGSNLKMGPGYAEVTGISTTSTVEVASGPAGRNFRPNLNTTLDIPWDDGLADKTLSTTFVYTVLPQ